MDGWWTVKENLEDNLNTKRNRQGIPGKGNNIRKRKKMETSKLYKLYSRGIIKSPQKARGVVGK